MVSWTRADGKFGGVPGSRALGASNFDLEAPSISGKLVGGRRVEAAGRKRVGMLMDALRPHNRSADRPNPWQEPHLTTDRRDPLLLNSLSTEPANKPSLTRGTSFSELVGSAMVFVVSNLPEVYKILAWKDRIQIWQFDSQSKNFHTIISNTGDGPVIVSAIVVYSSDSVGRIGITEASAPCLRRVLFSNQFKINWSRKNWVSSTLSERRFDELLGRPQSIGLLRQQRLKGEKTSQCVVLNVRRIASPLF
jgi:hypothetical protein